MHCWPAPPWMSSSTLIADAMAPLTGRPQVTAIRAIAIDGALRAMVDAGHHGRFEKVGLTARRQFTAQHQPDHVRKADVPISSWIGYPRIAILPG